MELLQLRYFYESSKNENFTKVAEKYQVPTTSVSASIKRLEMELGCQLFDRHSNCIVLNSNGRLLQQSLCSILSELDDVTEQLSSHKEDSREIRILVRGMRRQVTDLITKYSEKHASASFKTVFDYGELSFDDYDIIIDEENDRYADYERIELFHMNLKLKCVSSDTLCGQTLSLNQLCKHSFILMDTESNMNRVLTKACRRAGFTPKISILCNDIECYEKFIASGMGIGIGRENDTLNSTLFAIQDLNVTDFREHYTVYAYYSPKEYYGKIKSFVEFLKMNSI